MPQILNHISVFQQTLIGFLTNFFGGGIVIYLMRLEVGMIERSQVHFM